MMGRRDAARCGTIRRYKDGCRCFPCRIEGSRYRAELAQGRRRRRPVGPVAKHVRALMGAGMSFDEIAEAATVHPNTVRNVRARKVSQVSTRTATALLAVEAPPKPVRLPVEPLERHLEVRWRARGIEGAHGAFTATDRRYWCRARARGWVDEAWADRVAVRFGILLEEVYGPDLDAAGVAA